LLTIAPPPLGEHELELLLHAVVRAGQVDADAVVPDRVVGFVERAASAATTGVVEGGVEPAVVALEPLEQRGHRSRIADIGRIGVGEAAAGADHLGGLVGGRFAQVADRDPIALAGEAQGGGASDIAGRARDQNARPCGHVWVPEFGVRRPSPWPAHLVTNMMSRS
jgi:hypothetical protein